MKNRNGFGIPIMQVPQPLKNAQSEFARQLLGEDRTEDGTAAGATGLSSVKAGPVSVTFKDSKGTFIEDRLALARRDSLEAVVPDAVIMLLVPSWLKDVREEDAEFSGLVFENT
jgi:hypothetical protein